MYDCSHHLLFPLGSQRQAQAGFTLRTIITEFVLNLFFITGRLIVIIFDTAVKKFSMIKKVFFKLTLTLSIRM